MELRWEDHTQKSIAILNDTDPTQMLGILWVQSEDYIEKSIEKLNGTYPDVEVILYAVVVADIENIRIGFPIKQEVINVEILDESESTNE